MQKIETSLNRLKADIAAFYKPDQHHFITMNAVEVGDQMEYQWFFCDYGYPAEPTIFHSFDSPDALIPSIKEIVPSAWVAEAELVDLMGVNIEGTTGGFVLELDSEPAPQRKKK